MDALTVVGVMPPGVRFLATTQNIDTDQQNPVGRLLMQILAAVAEFERETIRERVKAGLVTARHKGVKCGRPTAVFDRKKAREMKSRGMSIRDIAAALKIGRSTVHRLLAA